MSTTISSESKTDVNAEYNAKTQLSVVEYPGLYPYMVHISLRMTKEQEKLWQEVLKHKQGIMASSPDESQFLGWLVSTIGAKKIIEVGVFMGSTTLALGLAVSNVADAKIVALDITTEFPSLGKKYWAEAKVDSKIDLRIGPAVESLKKILTAEGPNTYDMAFIDADKVNYNEYYELCLKLLRPGGVIAIDNVFWHGHVLDKNVTMENSPDTYSIQTLNEKIKQDNRVAITTVPMADGITLCRKL